MTSEPTAPEVAKNQDAKQPPTEQLYQQARQQASTGRCAEALTLSRKIAKVDPEFYKKRVAGDPTLNACNAPRSKLKAAPAARAPADEQQQQQQGSDKSAK